MLSKGRFLAAATVAVLAAGLGLFMRWEHARHEVSGAASSCSLSAAWDCDLVQSSDYARVLGVSMSLWGAAANLVLLLWLLAWRRTGEPTLLLLAGAFAGLNALVAVAMFGLSWLAIGAFCLYCTMLQLCLVGLAALLVPPAFRCWRAGLRRQPALLGTLALLAIGLLMFAGEAYASNRARLGRHFHGPVGAGERLEVADALYLGDPASPVSVLVYFDFGCPFCRRCYGKAKHLLARHPGQVHFIFKHYPIDRTCNRDGVDSTLHPGACDAARAGQAAALLGRTRVAMDYIFGLADKGASFSRLVLDGLGRRIDVERDEWRRMQAAPEVERLLQRDLKEGQALDLPKVPVIYVNGRQVEEIDLITTVDRLAKG